ncbi:MAG: CmcI family methyltransferase [Acidimicrobiales bacterium]
MIGEGSFHQLHGGTTTNQPDPSERRSRVFGYSEHYADLRGKGFKGPGKPLHFRGPAAHRGGAAHQGPPPAGEGVLGGRGFRRMPDAPVPICAGAGGGVHRVDLAHASVAGHELVGSAITSAPTDLLAYQELIERVRPDVVIETGAADGGRSLFLASICELVGHGRVVAVGPDRAVELPGHDRLAFVDGAVSDPEVLGEVERAVEGGRALVVLGGRADRVVTHGEFKALSPMVPVGSYVVVTDTIVNGNPVWPAFGPGPAEAVKQILRTHGNFVQDSAMEKYALTFNPGGFLLRQS